jgi:hypothetical protein
MSDAKAKAEARRAKILAREGTRLLVAKGEKDSLNEPIVDEEASPSVKRERPLAARRNLVAATKVDEAGVEGATEDKTAATTTANDTADAPVPAPVPVAATATAASPATDKSAATAITSQRTRDIEKEIARNTAKFDENIVKKDEKTVIGTKEEEKVKFLKKMALKAAKAPLQAHQAMRFIRLLAIIVLGMVTGYQSATRNMNEVGSFARQQPRTPVSDAGAGTVVDTARLALGAFISGGSGGAIPHFDGAVLQPAVYDVPGGRTWFQWGQNKIVRQLECSLTAVGLVWWVTSMLSPMVSRAFPKQQNSNGIMNMVISFYNNGMEGLIEGVVSRLGELALHLFVTVGTAMAVTFLFGVGVEDVVASVATVAAGAGAGAGAGQTIETMAGSLGTAMEWEAVGEAGGEAGAVAGAGVEAVVEAVVGMAGEAVQG